MTIQATYHGEVRVVRSSYTSKTGPTLTLALHDIDELNKVQGMDGKRYMLALVEIGDDEQPVQEKPVGGFVSEWLAMRCSEQSFRSFLIEKNPFGWKQITSEAVAADVVRKWCGVKSRAEIDHNIKAKEIFDIEIRLPFLKWCAINNKGVIKHGDISA